MTFNPPPHQVLHPGSERPPLTTIPQRAELLHSLRRANHVVVLQNKPALRLALSCGSVLRGRDRCGNSARKRWLKGTTSVLGAGGGTNDYAPHFCPNRGPRVRGIPQFALNSEPVSSSRRAVGALVSGDVAARRNCWAVSYSHHGNGDYRRCAAGRTIGFPTANLGDVPTVLPGPRRLARCVRLWTVKRGRPPRTSAPIPLFRRRCT